MKKKNIIEQIALEMASNEKYMPDKKYVIADELITEKLEQIQNYEQTDRDGRTLLINAAFYNRINAIKYLLKKNVNIHAKDNKGFTALHAAVQEENIEIIKILLENGAEVNSKNIYGNTPVLLCNPFCSKTVFKILMSYGADPTIANNYGVSANHKFETYPEILSILNNLND